MQGSLSFSIYKLSLIERDSVLQDDVVEDSMEVDIRHHRHFVCRRGQVLRELAEEYGGIAVSFPRTGVNSQRVTLKGAKECVEAAKKRIQEIIEDLVREKNMRGFNPVKLALS